MKSQKASLVLLLLSTVVFTTGCGAMYGPRKHATYVSQKVCNECCPFRGVPVQVYKPFAAVVTWRTKENATTKTIHFIKLPELFAVDCQKAFLGITDADLELNADGTLKKFDANIDQEIPEILTSVSEILNAIPMDPAAREAYLRMKEGEIPNNTFYPPLPTEIGQIAGMSWVPMEEGQCVDVDPLSGISGLREIQHHERLPVPN